MNDLKTEAMNVVKQYIDINGCNKQRERTKTKMKIYCQHFKTIEGVDYGVSVVASHKQKDGSVFPVCKLYDTENFKLVKTVSINWDTCEVVKEFKI